MAEEQEYDEFLSHPQLIFGTDKYDNTMLPPEHFMGATHLELQNKGKKAPTIVKMYGERHTGEDKLGEKKADEIKSHTLRFLNNELIGNPNSRLLIETYPHYGDEYGTSQSILNDTAMKISKIHPDRVGTVDRRKELDAPRLPKDATIVELRRVQRAINDEIKHHYIKYPEFERIFQEHTIPANKGFPGRFHAPLFDAQLLDEIERAQKNGYNLITYTGDAHRNNIVRTLKDIKGTKIIGSGFARRRIF